MSVVGNGLLQRIEEILRQKLLGDTIVDVSPSGIRDKIHVLVVSRQLDGLSERQKQEFVWSALEGAGLDQAELGRISLVLPLSVDELKR